jgi:Mg2+-importing ATPase
MPNAPPAGPQAFWSQDPEALFAALRSSSRGLTAAEAEQRLREHGFNALDEEPAAGVGRLLARQFKSPLVLILVFGGVVSATLREWLDAAIILAVVLGSCGLGFAQEWRASTAVAQLRRRLALTVQTLRDGRQQTV